MTNRLAQETSPYLLQHRDNPVDWYPWGEEALARAREEDRPILLSVGYSACHWCHVMERESFEDAETAAYMNEHFVNVKVDREERPDVDAIYMEAVQAMSGHGGWPMTVFLDPDGVPFYGGTYFPPDEGRGMPSFRMVMEAVVDAFERQREEIRERAAERPGRDWARSAWSSRRPSGPRRRNWRRRWRGCSPTPTAPAAASAAPPSSRPPRPSSCCWRGGERAIVERTLDAMLAGGIYDQLGGGFARYSVDAVWLVPHFEKMLYDNALLAPAYLHGWQRARPRALPPRLRGDAGLDAARDARPRGRLLLGPRRRLRGRGGPLLRLDPGADPRGSGRGGRAGARVLRRQRARQLRGQQHPPPRRRRRGRFPPACSAKATRRVSTRPAAPSTRRGRSASGRGSTTSG